MQPSDTLPQIRTKYALKDLTSQVFGNLRVISRAGTYQNNKSKEATWQCECVKCGHRSIVRGYFLRTGKTKGTNCPGCKPDRSHEPALPIDEAFVEKYENLIFAAIGSVLKFGSPLFTQYKQDIFQEVLLQLVNVRGVHEKAISTLIWQIARNRAINFLHTAQKNPSVKASADDEAEGNYDFVLESLTDGAQELEFNEKVSRIQEAFSELTDEEQTFAAAYVQDSKFKTTADRQRMCVIRKRLKARVEELKPHVNLTKGNQEIVNTTLKASDSIQEVHADR